MKLPGPTVTCIFTARTQQVGGRKTEIANILQQTDCSNVLQHNRLLIIILYNETTVHKYSMYRMQASAQAYITYTTYLSFGDDYEGVDELQLGLQVRGLVHILTALLHHSSYCLCKSIHVYSI